MLSVKKLKEMIKEIEGMPPLSQSATRLMELTRDEDHGLADVTRIVAHDPALTANVLKVVNAPGFGLGSKVESLDRAVGFLGEKVVVGIALSTCAPGVFGADLGGYESQRGELWRHCLCVALATREMVKLAKRKINSDLAFTGGILHDIGKSLLSEYLRGKVPMMLVGIEAEMVGSFLEAEKDQIGTDHCEIGFLLAEHWHLPEPLKQVIRFHHTPSQADEEHRGLVYVVHLCDMIAMMSGTGTGADALQYPLDENFADHVSLEPEDLERIVLNTTIEFEKMKAEIFGNEEE